MLILRARDGKILGGRAYATEYRAHAAGNRYRRKRRRVADYTVKPVTADSPPLGLCAL